jgi:hypothetical protein
MNWQWLTHDASGFFIAVSVFESHGKFLGVKLKIERGK